MSKWEYLYDRPLAVVSAQKRSSPGLSLIWFMLQQNLSLLTSKMLFQTWLLEKFAFPCQAVEGTVPHRRHHDLPEMKCFLLQPAQMGEQGYWRHCCLPESPVCSLDSHNHISLLKEFAYFICSLCQPVLHSYQKDPDGNKGCAVVFALGTFLSGCSEATVQLGKAGLGSLEMLVSLSCIFSKFIWLH